MRTRCACSRPIPRSGNLTGWPRARRMCRPISYRACVPTTRLKPFRGSLSPHDLKKEDRMSDVIDRPVPGQEAFGKSRLRIIDCDIHPSLHAKSDLNPFLAKRWQEHLKTYGDHLRTPYIGTPPYPRSSPLIARRDAWPPTGGPPGSHLAFLRKPRLAPLDIEFGILQVLD